MKDTPDQSTARRSTTSTDEPALSVVVVTYNEADRVRACLESVLECCRDRPETEVILVDSNSTDDTVEIACEYPITVLQIPDDDLTTPGAGRYVGTHAASGDRILFVDGDIELTTGWLDDAMAILDEQDDVAGVDGHLEGVDGDLDSADGSLDGTHSDRDGSDSHPEGVDGYRDDDRYPDGDDGRRDDVDSHGVESVRMLHGVVLFDAVILEAVGGFDPFLLALEDSELSARLQHAGYRLLRLPAVVGRHPVSTGTAEVARRWRNGYYFGLGQVFRKALAEGRIVDALVPRNPYILLFDAWFLAGAVAALFGVATFAVWLAVSAVCFAADVAWEGPSRAIQRSIAYAIVPLGVLRGALLTRREPAEYPLETTVTVQRADRDATAATVAEP